MPPLYLLTWSGGYEPVSMFMTMNFEEAKTEWANWKKYALPDEDLQEAFLCTKENDATVFLMKTLKQNVDGTLLDEIM